VYRLPHVCVTDKPCSEPNIEADLRRWFAMTILERQGRPAQYVRGAISSWTGNLVGAVFFAGVFTYATETLGQDPFKSGTVEMVTHDIVEQHWHVIFLRGIVCGFLVCAFPGLSFDEGDPLIFHEGHLGHVSGHSIARCDIEGTGTLPSLLYLDYSQMPARSRVHVPWVNRHDARCTTVHWRFLLEMLAANQPGQYHWGGCVFRGIPMVGAHRLWR